MFSCPMYLNCLYNAYEDYNWRASYTITVNRKNHTLTLYRNNQLFKVYPVAIGKMLTPTPAGLYRIKNKAPNPGGPYGARWLGLNIPSGGYGIHGTNNPSSIGMDVSHGCIRMYNSAVIELYNLVPVGTVVNIV